MKRPGFSARAENSPLDRDGAGRSPLTNTTVIARFNRFRVLPACPENTVKRVNKQ
jgi:hypothetical protein